jgi:hypothetical protein
MPPQDNQLAVWPDLEVNMSTGESPSKLTERLQQATSELRNLAQALPAADIDSRVLVEFREAVNHVRQTAWAVQQWIQLKQQQADPFSVISLLAVERVRVAAMLLKSLTLDLDSSDVNMETEGIGELYKATQAFIVRMQRE